MNNLLTKTVSLILAFCLMLAFVPSILAYAADNGPGQYRVNVSSTLRMRSGPGTDYEVLVSIPNNTNVLVTETQNGWGKIEFAGETGWISLDYAIYYADTQGNLLQYDQREEIVKVAQGEVGYKEGKNNYTKYGVWYASWAKNSPWCGIFVSWCAYQAGISESIVPKFSYCATGIELFKNLGVWKSRSYVPQAGDIIFFRSSSASSASDHVGIVVSCDGKRVYTIEGNSSDAVSERNYLLTNTYIVGYASPKYETRTITTTSTSTTTTATTTSSATVSSTDVTSTTTITTTTTTTTTPTTAPTGTVTHRLTVSGSVVNVRAAAGMSGAKIATVRRGAVYDVFGTEKDSDGNVWYKIVVGGNVGYIISKYATVTEVKQDDDTQDEQQEQLVVITGNPVNVRSGAGTSFSRLGKVYKGEILTVTGSTTVSGVVWYQVIYDGQTGYVSGDYAKITGQLKVTGAAVNIRTDAGTGNARVGSVRRGQLYILLGSKYDANGTLWYSIEYNGSPVYICGDYAKPVY